MTVTAEDPEELRVMDRAPSDRVPPLPGTRPPNRKALIVDAAADLFYQRGYAEVAMADVAAAVNVRASSLYRHFAGKSELLSAVLREELAPFREAAAGASSLDGAISALALTATQRPRLAVLWQRESRALSSAEWAPRAGEIHDLTHELVTLLGSQRPDLPAEDAELLVWCALSILRTAGSRGGPPAAPETARLIDLLSRVLRLVPRHGSEIENVKPPWVGFHTHVPHSTREQLLAVTAPLLAASGYAGVSLEEIASRAGLAGPSIYHYFGSKQDLVFAALSRAAEGVLLDMQRALGNATDPSDAVRRLSESYLTFATTNSALVDVLITDAHHLTGRQRTSVMQSQESFMAEWTHVLLQAEPALKPAAARSAVRATVAVINDFARSLRLRQGPDVFPNVVALVLEIQRGPIGPG